MVFFSVLFCGLECFLNLKHKMLQIVSLFLFSHPSSSSETTNTYFYSGLAAQPVGSQFPDQGQDPHGGSVES